MQTTGHSAARDYTAAIGRLCRKACGRAQSLIRRFRSDQRGNMVIMAGITLPVAVGAVGAAVAFSSANSTRTNMQQALDAAVLAGVTSSDVASVQTSTANNYFQSNLDSFALSRAGDITASFTVSGSTLSGTATGHVTNPFGGLIGSKTIATKVTAAATRKETPVCVLGLNGLDKGSFDINGSAAKFNANCAVQANTNSTYGMTMEGGPTAKASRFGVTGGHKGDGFYPPPSDGSPNMADPYASLPFPAYDDCPNGKGINMTDVKNNRKLKPGTYCYGIHIYGGAQVTMDPGVYVMWNGPFWVNGGATVSGTEVMIAFTGKGSSLQVWGNSSVSLTSPISGTYMNMQFLQNWADDSTRSLWASVGGSDGNDTGDGSKLTFDGVAYFPTQNFWAFGNSILNANSPSMAIVADKIWTQGSAAVTVTNANPRGLPVTTVPKVTTGVALVK